MADSHERFLLEQLNPNYGYFLRVGKRIVQSATEFQSLEVFETPMFGRLLRLDGVFQTSERDEFFYHENIAHVPAIAHPRPRSALVVGGGDGGTVEELLKHACMEKVVMAELDGGVVEAAKEYLGEIHRGVFSDPRLDVRIMDGKAYIEQTSDRYDQVILDLTDPFGPSLALFTHEFYAACKQTLNPGGVLSLHVESPISRPNTFNRIIKTLESVFRVVCPYLVYVPLYGTWWAMAVASDDVDPLALSEGEVDRRIAERALSDLQYYNGATHKAVFAMPNFVREVLKQPAEIIHVGSPALEDEIALNLDHSLGVCRA